MLAVNHPNDFTVAENGHGQFAASRSIVHEVVLVGLGVVDNFSHPSVAHTPYNAPSNRQFHRFMDGAVVQIFGAISGLLNPCIADRILQVNHTVLQPQFVNHGRGDVPQNILCGVLPKDTLGKIFYDVQLLFEVGCCDSFLAQHHGKKPNGHHEQHQHKNPPKQRGEGPDVQCEGCHSPNVQSSSKWSTLWTQELA